MKIKIAVKIGSHLTTVNLNDKIVTCDDFIRVALKQCNLIKSATELIHTYALFERLNGIEMMINAEANILSLWSTKWSTLAHDNNFSLIIKKYKRSETLCKFIEKNEKRMHKLFEISRQMSIQNIAHECDKSEITNITSHHQKQQHDKLKMRLQSLSIYQDKSTSGESALSNSSGAKLIKTKQSNTNNKLSDKKRFLKKFFIKTDAHAKNLIRNLSNSSFLSLSKVPSMQKTVFQHSKLDATYSHYYEEINGDGNLI